MEQEVHTGIAVALRALQQATEDARRSLARRLDLGLTDVAALDHLIRSPIPLGPVELGDRLGIRSASATVLVDRLERAGHVVRTEHPRDRRRRVLTTTEDARASVLLELQPLIEPLHRLAQALTTDEARVVLRFLEEAADIHARFAVGDGLSSFADDDRDGAGSG